MKTCLMEECNMECLNFNPTKTKKQKEALKDGELLLFTK